YGEKSQGRQPALGSQLVHQVSALEQLHDVIKLPWAELEVVHLDQIRVMQSIEECGFASESLFACPALLAVHEAVDVQLLDSDVRYIPLAASAIDDTHAAARNLTDQLILAEVAFF